LPYFSQFCLRACGGILDSSVRVDRNHVRLECVTEANEIFGNRGSQIDPVGVEVDVVVSQRMERVTCPAIFGPAEA
jgi:hypothetical protein